jgi:acetylornithine deacetylase/succinyl-diaminopimelate desuccinylase-like protein
MSAQAVKARIESDFAQHLERVRAFVRQPSISGTGEGVLETAELCAAEIRALGGRAELAPTQGHPVVWGTLDAGAPKTLLFYGMYDVQPVTGESWIVPPFGGEIVDLPSLGPSVVNRGIANQKGPLLGFFNTLRAFRDAGIRLPVNLKFVIEGEEELGSVHLPDFVDAYRERLAADGCFFGMFCQDVRGMPNLYLGVKGILFMELTVRGGDWGGPVGRMIHGSNAAQFASPSWRLVHVLASMVGADESVLVDDFFRDVKPPSATDERLIAALADDYDADAVLRFNDAKRFKHPGGPAEQLRHLICDPTLNIDGVEAGYMGPGTKTLLPHEAKARIDVRMVPDMEPDRVIATLERHIANLGLGGVSLRVMDTYPWSQTDPSEPIVTAMRKAIRDEGHEAMPWPRIAGSAPFYLFTRRLRLPTIAGGLGHGGRQHSPNEYATVSGIKAYERSVAGFLFDFAAGA